jgi:hypothetical protein
MPRRIALRAGATALAALVALAVGASSANAGVLTASTPSCDDQPVSKPFTPWLDVADYTPLPGADFEGAASDWSFARGAHVAPGNSSFGAGGASSLALPSGGSAVSAPICVGLMHPTMRFFARRRSTGVLSTLRVDVLFTLSTEAAVSLPIGIVANGGSWQPTQPLFILVNYLLPPDGHASIAFRFTAQGGDWSVDDVFVDPYSRK